MGSPSLLVREVRRLLQPIELRQLRNNVGAKGAESRYTEGCRLVKTLLGRPPEWTKIRFGVAGTTYHGDENECKLPWYRYACEYSTKALE